MIRTGAGKVEGLTGAGTFGESSVIFSTAFVSHPPNSRPTKCWRRGARSNPVEYAASFTTADTVLTRPTYDDKAQTCQRDVVQLILLALSMVDIIPTRVTTDAWFLDLDEIAVLTI